MSAARREAAPKQPHRITIMVNGQVTGSVEAGPTLNLATLSQQVARDHGLRSFTIKVNGTKTLDINKNIQGAKTVELVAKDSRG
jgi:hypothetical protein